VIRNTGFKATQPLYRCKRVVLERKNSKTTDFLIGKKQFSGSEMIFFGSGSGADFLDCFGSVSLFRILREMCESVFASKALCGKLALYS
jgi:hypothetical protein